MQKEGKKNMIICCNDKLLHDVKVFVILLFFTHHKHIELTHTPNAKRNSKDKDERKNNILSFTIISFMFINIIYHFIYLLKLHFQVSTYDIV